MQLIIVYQWKDQLQFTLGADILIKVKSTEIDNARVVQERPNSSRQTLVEMDVILIDQTLSIQGVVTLIKARSTEIHNARVVQERLNSSQLKV